MTHAPKTTYLKDYTPYPYALDSVDLLFQMQEGYTDVIATLIMEKRAEEPLFLHGEDLELLDITLDDKPVDYDVDEIGITLKGDTPSRFTLWIKTRIRPEDNTRLSGLYTSGGTYCTQCESQGFRRITYFPDRPDVMSIYTVRLEADKAKYPILLSNGNLTDSGDLDNGRHFATWHDPHKKPCYLFALVAGDLTHIHDTFTTASGRTVDLYIYVRPDDEDQCAHAMESLKHSMTWDEDVYGLEYDLDIFNIVAVSDFNMGAMENKSLNIFNTALVLAHPETATDLDFYRVESVIAHEYFHNWSGNRVTCRDWFQLSLKEGLTVFRDQEFSADRHSRDVVRIDDVQSLRRGQFVEDASPLAHPIRPDNYIEINNFYTHTVYHKGAEVIRMVRTLMGKATYRKATDLYFSRHDGDAATCEDWLKCMEDASGLDLSQYALWYSQAGTPVVRFSGRYDAEGQSYHVRLTQSHPTQPDNQPMHMPIAIGLLGRDGQDLVETQVLQLQHAEQVFVIEGVTEEPIPSVLRGFSAPVLMQASQSDADLCFLMAHDSDGFNRWDAAQQAYRRGVEAALNKQDVPEALLEAIGLVIDGARDGDHALAARMLSVPDVVELSPHFTPIDPPALLKARDTLMAAIKRTHRKALDKLYKALAQDGAFDKSAKAAGQRALRNVCLAILTATHGSGCAKAAAAHYEAADNMTDRMAALGALARSTQPQRAEVYADFYDRFKDHALVMDKWFAVQAGAPHKDITAQLETLRAHADFTLTNPNRVRSLYAAFAMNNPAAFHARDGSGYDFLLEGINALNGINPQIAARLMSPLRSWRDYTPDRQEKMKAMLEAILALPGLAPDVYEIASKSLKG